LAVAERRDDNSPAFQCREQFGIAKVPLGRTPCQNHFAMDVWGNWRLKFLSREGGEVAERRMEISQLRSGW